MQFLLASKNAKKLLELRQLLADARLEDLEVVGADDLDLPEVVEDQPDFVGNARKKACESAQATGLWTLADDSGLEVDALDGAPGVYSARFAGRHGDDAANNRLLLERLAGVPAEERGARFVCVLALAAPDGEPVAEFRGTVRGRILEATRGTGGFGYDPLFLFDEAGEPGQGQTFAELTHEEKAAVGHRGRAMRELARELPRLLPAASDR